MITSLSKSQEETPNGKHPLRQRIEAALNQQDGFNEELARSGFNSSAEVAECRDLTELAEKIKDKQTDVVESPPSYEFYRKAHRHQQLVAQVMRDVTVSQDPLSQGLRHVQPPALPQVVVSVLQDEPKRYAKPDSIQSIQSPAAYLKHIYDLATEQIEPNLESWALDTRRPGLKNLELSEDNLHQEITTLELVNEVLLSKLAENVFSDLKTQLHPLALPFNKELATVRTGLAQIEGMNVNAIARRSQEDDYALTKGQFTLIPYTTDALSLLESEITALQQDTNDNSNLITEIFGENFTAADLKYVDSFIEATDITYEEFHQLYRDYTVKDEAGESYTHGGWGARLYTSGSLSLVEDNGRLRMKVNGNQDLSDGHFVGMNHLVRLYKRTGLSFHQLDQLLCSIPEASEFRKLNDESFNVLAHYLYWHQQYKLSVDKFIALLTEVNCWRRMGEQKEPTLMRQMFSQDAPQITTIVLEGTTKLSEVETETENGITLGDILRRGLKLTRREWQEVVSLVMANDDDTPLNQETLARLYRLATLFPLLNWDILSAIQLVGKIDQSLLTTLGTESDDIISEVFPALDKLAWLSQWMESAELSVTDLLLVLTPPEEAVLQTTQQVSNWLHELNQAIDSHLLNSESDFAIYRDWIKENGEVAHIEDWLEQLQGKDILDNSGLVQSVTKSEITGAVTEILESAQVDNEANEELKAQLINFLAETQFNQEQVLFEQVVKIAEDDNPEIVAPVLLWLGTDVYKALSTLLSDNETKQLQLLYDLRRHLQLTSKLSFTSATVEMLCQQPEWLVSDMTIPLSLKQVYYLERFKQLQNAEASEPMWLAYFITRWKDEGIDSEQVNKLLALLLDFNQEDIKVLRENADGGEMKTVQQVEALSRQIQLCRDLSISATELITLNTEGLNSGTEHAAAAAAVLGGLARSSDENLATLAENALNEKIRDALVAAVFYLVIAKDEELKRQIKDSEGLYSYLLLDVNVTSAVPTSRIIEAQTSVQLYIHRMLEGVESGDFDNKDAFKEEWGNSSTVSGLGSQ